MKECDYGALLLNLTTSSLSKAQRRWRIAYTAIYSLRALLSLVKRIVPHNLDFNSPLISLSAPLIPTINSMPLSFVPHLDQDRLVEVMKEKDLQSIAALGGVESLAASLRTDHTKGIRGNEQELTRRRDLFGSNTYHKPPPKGLLFFVYEAFKDTTILILLACAILSLGFGIKEHGIKEGWYEGGSISIAVFLVIAVSALSNFRQERQFDKLSKISNNIKVEVLRDGRRQQISIFDIVVGDIVFLKIGDQIPADGLFLDGHSLYVDESSMTGESEHVEVDHNENPFLFSGTKVVDGFGQMLVLSVGMNTTWGQTMSSINQDSNERTPLQVRLDTLTSTIGKVGLTVAALVLLVLLLRYFTGNTEDNNGKREYHGSKTPVDDVFNAVVRIVAAAVTIVVVAIPEGLPLAVTLTLAYSMKRMMSDQAMVRKLSACETMGSATVICTDKTGTLTLNEMKVTKFWVGQESIHEDSCKMLSPDVLEMFYQGAGLNTTGSVCVTDSGVAPEFSGSPTEKALLSWAVLKLGMDIESVKQNHDVLRVETFNSTKKRSGVLLRRKSDNRVHVHWKGAAEMILDMCSRYYTSRGSVDSMDSDMKSRFEAIIQGMAASSLRCIAFAHKETSDNSHLEEDGLSLMGIVGLKDPCRPGVAKAVEACKLAGVNIKMITGDNVFTAKAIAVECGILEHGDQDDEEAVVEGFQFRNYNDRERTERVDKIRVMARSSPSDKLLMVKCLRQKGHVVAVTGDGTNDAPASERCSSCDQFHCSSISR